MISVNDFELDTTGTISEVRVHAGNWTYWKLVDHQMQILHEFLETA